MIQVWPTVRRGYLQFLKLIRKLNMSGRDGPSCGDNQSKKAVKLTMKTGTRWLYLGLEPGILGRAYRHLALIIL